MWVVHVEIDGYTNFFYYDTIEAALKIKQDYDKGYNDEQVQVWVSEEQPKKAKNQYEVYYLKKYQ